MKKFVLQVFVNEVQHQCEFANFAYQNIINALHPGNSDQVFFAAHSFLMAVGNISKLLWPSNKLYAARGRELRKLLQVSDNSVLKPRDFRNHFEHFDERLEKWAKSSKRKSFVDSNILPPGAISGINPEDWMRNLDPTFLILSFHGDSYNIPEIMEAIKPIWATAKCLKP